MKTIVFINEFAEIVPESESKYKVTLTGSWYFSGITKEYAHEIEKVEPFLPLSKLNSKTLLVDAGFDAGEPPA